MTGCNSFNLWVFARFGIGHGLEEITTLAVT